jgi:hypothetical protein
MHWPTTQGHSTVPSLISAEGIGSFRNFDKKWIVVRCETFVEKMGIYCKLSKIYIMAAQSIYRFLFSRAISTCLVSSERIAYTLMAPPFLGLPRQFYLHIYRTISFLRASPYDQFLHVRAVSTAEHLVQKPCELPLVPASFVWQALPFL